jgi:mono/diheme cytochrome c family protein
MRLLALIGALGIVIAVAAAGYFFLGFYNISATLEEPDIVKWALIRVRMASIDRHAVERQPSGFDDAANVQAGARAYSIRGCVHCHGGPGTEWTKFSEGLRPDPPDLKDVAAERQPRELFWVIKNGINMTGMPSFGAIDVPDAEIWKIVGFLKKLGTVSDADYKAWTEAAPAKP